MSINGIVTSTKESKKKTFSISTPGTGRNSVWFSIVIDTVNDLFQRLVINVDDSAITFINLKYFAAVYKLVCEVHAYLLENYETYKEYVKE